MKFFSELGSCWGGSAVGAPAAEASDRDRQTADLCRRTSRRLPRTRSSGGAVAPWKPKLTAISEDSPMTTAVDRTTAGDDERKRTVKVKSKSMAAIAPVASVGEDYWKSANTSALQAFAPMWFAF